MTIKDFADLYKGRRVMVNENYYAPGARIIGTYGTIAGTTKNVFDRVYVGVKLDNAYLELFKPDELDLIAEVDCSPLPLPG
jgi:hypothetical protein